MAKVLPFKGGVVVSDSLGNLSEASPLGITHQGKKVKFFDLFRIYRQQRFESKPLLYTSCEFEIKKEREYEFFHLCWEFEVLEIIYRNFTRPYSNEELNYLIPKLARITKDISDINKFMGKKLGDKENSKPKKTIGDLSIFSLQESRKELLSTKRLTMLLELEAEKDLKRDKKNRPREALILIYPIQILKKIYNCLDIKRDWKHFIHQELIKIPSLKDLRYITIETAIKKSKRKAFLDQYLRSIKDEDEFNEALKFIFE